MTYLDYWNLDSKPFAHRDPQRFYCGPAQREAIAGLSYLAMHDLPAAVMSSDSGCGTTSLLRQVSATSGFGNRAVELLLTEGDQMSVDGVWVELAAALGLTASSADLEDRICRAIHATARQGVKTIWLVDQCRLPAARVACRLISREPLFAAVLVAQRLAASHLTEIISDLQKTPSPMQLDLGPLSLSETSEYVQHSLHLAGGRRDSWLDSAIIRLFEFGQGRLSTMSTAAESAMILAARHRLEMVSPALIEAASEPIQRAA